MKNGNMPAAPTVYADMGHNGQREIFCDNQGLTKREHFAAMAMQAVVSVTPHQSIKHLGALGDVIAESALRIADDPLAELEKQNEA